MNQKLPHENEPGDECNDIDKRYLREIVGNSPLVSQGEWIKLQKNHQKFLKSGGAGGEWSAMNVNGIIIGVYAGPKSSKGKMALLNNRNLEGLNFHGLELPWANLVGVLAQNFDFQKVNLRHCLVTDAFLSGSSFRNANLEGIDFSRSDLTDCDFSNANLRGADFENCLLVGSTFTGAQLEESRFPGIKR
jgi:uncharacterized protein YjbI with pentapeptide repeats